MLNEQIIQIETNFDVSWARRRNENGVWIAWCDLLGLTVEADNHDELVSLISEAIAILFEDLLESGDFDNFLKSKGWRSTGPIVHQPGQRVRFDLPWTMFTNGAQQPAAARC